MSPIIVHQAKDYYEDIHFNIPLDWEFHHTPPGYMDRDRWLKSITQLFNICGTSLVSNQIFFFYGHDIHFDDHTPIHMDHQNIQTFIMKLGDSVNEQPNYNGTNSKFKSLYNEAKNMWMLKYGTTICYLTT